MVIEENGLRVLTDPGAWTTAQNKITGIDIILITHEHADHFHVESVKTILKNNPLARISTNSGVGKILSQENIPFTLLEDKNSLSVRGVNIEAYGKEHAYIYKTVPTVVNTGYFIDGRFFYPGDNFYNPQKPVEILALPVAGPWMKIADALEYLHQIKPKKAFPVHDGMLKIFGGHHAHPAKILESLGGKFIIPELGKEMEF